MMETQVDYFNKNINELKELQPELVEKMETIDLNKNKEVNFQIYKNSNNEYVLKYISSEGNYIHYTSYYNPVKQAKQMVERINCAANRSSVVCFGIGLGYQIDELLGKINPKSVIFVIERDITLLKEVLKIKDYSEAIKNKNIIFIVGDIEDKDLYMQIARYFRLFPFNIIHMQGVFFSIFDNGYTKYIGEITDYVNNLKEVTYFSIGNDVDDTLDGIKNMFDNLPRYIRSCGTNDLKKDHGDKFENKPAIIIASGPSLDKNIALLKEAKGKALLLACDGSMASLRKHGITPDAVGSVERIYKTYEAFYLDKRFDNDVVLMAPAVVRKEIPDKFDNKIVSFFKNDNIALWFNNAILDKGVIWSAASVAHQMFGIAHELGCNPIILIGQDLAYSEDGISHVAEAEVKEKVDLKDANVFVKGKNGRMIPSTYTWQQFLVIFEEAFRVVDRKIIDATEGGAYIKGTEIKSLRETIDEYCKEEIPNLRSCVDSIEVDEEYIQKASENAIRLAQKEVKRMNLFKLRAEKALKYNSKALYIMEKEIKKQKQLDEIYDSIEYVEDKIVKRVFKYIVVEMLLQPLIFKAAYKISSINDTQFNINSLRFNLEVHNKMLKDIIYFLNKAIIVFREGINNIEKQYEQNYRN